MQVDIRQDSLPVEEEDDKTSVAASTTSSKRKAINKNAKILKIVNMIFEKKKKDKVRKLETEFADGSKLPFNFNFVVSFIPGPL
jgi:hypothetical protein